MNYKAFRNVLLAVSLLSSLSAGAQQEEMTLQLSTENATYWYRICNASEGVQDYAMTDCSALDDICQVQLLKTENNEEKSQWKLTAGEDGKVVLTNRATGLKLNGASINIGKHNATQLTAEKSQGFTITALGDEAFSMESVENDGINRCLALAERDAEALVYPTANVNSSAIAWKFTLVETITEVKSTEAEKPVIRVKNHRVFVSGCSEWQLFNALGEEMPRTTSLASGTYMVKTPKETVKVLVP